MDAATHMPMSVEELVYALAKNETSKTHQSSNQIMQWLQIHLKWADILTSQGDLFSITKTHISLVQGCFQHISDT